MRYIIGIIIILIWIVVIIITAFLSDDGLDRDYVACISNIESCLDHGKEKLPYKIIQHIEKRYSWIEGYWHCFVYVRRDDVNCYELEYRNIFDDQRIIHINAE